MDLRYGYCTTCLKIATEDDKLVKLNYSLPGEAKFHSKLIYCVSEMILENLETSSLCKPCSAVLETTFTFKSMCLNNIKKLRDIKAHISAIKAPEESADRIQSDEIPTFTTSSYDNNQRTNKTVQTVPIRSTSSSNYDNQNIEEEDMHDGLGNRLQSFDLNLYSNSFDFTPPKKICVNQNSRIESVKNDLDNLLSVSLAGSLYFNKSTSKLPPENVRSEPLFKQRKKSLNIYKKCEIKNVKSTSKEIANTKLTDEEIITTSCKAIPALKYHSPTALNCEVKLDRVDELSLPSPNSKQQQKEILQQEVGSLSSLRCSICEKRFATQSAMTIHILRHIGIPPFRCNECEKCFYCRSALTNHYKVDHNISGHLKYEDEIREMTEIALDMVENYISGNIGQSNTKQLKKPKRTLDNQQKNQSKFRCLERSEKINSVVKEPQLLDNKVQSETNHKPFTCKICKATFSHRGDYMRHKKSHLIENKLPNETSNCTIVKKPQLLDHKVGSKTNHKPFLCKICKATFTQRGDYMRHKRSHLIENKLPTETSNSQKEKKKYGKYYYFCSICNRNFTFSDHKYIHTGEKPYKCTMCTKCFRTSQNLHSHMRRWHPSSTSKRNKKHNKGSEKQAKLKQNEKKNKDPLVETISSSNEANEVPETDLETTICQIYKCELTENELQMDVCQNVTADSTEFQTHLIIASNENVNQNMEPEAGTKSRPNEEPDTDVETISRERFKCELTENELQIDVTSNSAHFQPYSSTASKENTTNNKEHDVYTISSSNEENEEPESDFETIGSETFKCEFTENELQMDVGQNVTENSTDVCKICENEFSDTLSLIQHVALHAINECAG